MTVDERFRNHLSSRLEYKHVRYHTRLARSEIINYVINFKSPNRPYNETPSPHIDEILVTETIESEQHI